VRIFTSSNKQTFIILKIKKMKNWNQFLVSCKIAWETEGQQEKEVAAYLRRCEKTPKMSLLQVAASAYRLYKSEN
jgi:hypothetical protein